MYVRTYMCITPLDARHNSNAEIRIEHTEIIIIKLKGNHTAITFHWKQISDKWQSDIFGNSKQTDKNNNEI